MRRFSEPQAGHAVHEESRTCNTGSVAVWQAGAVRRSLTLSWVSDVPSRIDGPTGARWDLALDLIANGTESVVLGSDLVVQRYVGWPGADGLIHIGVLSSTMSVTSREAAQLRVHELRSRFDDVARTDHRLRALLHDYPPVWEYLSADGYTTVKLADVSDDGTIIWT